MDTEIIKREINWINSYLKRLEGHRLNELQRLLVKASLSKILAEAGIESCNTS